MDNPLGYLIQAKQTGGYWATYAYENMYDYAVRIQKALKQTCNETRIYSIKDSSIKGI